MPEIIEDLPVKKIKVAAQNAARGESAPAPVRRYRVVLFQIALVVVAGSFGVLTFLVKTMSFFAIDLQITAAVQQFNFPPFAFLMNLISWPGFLPQSIVITGLILLLIYSFGLHWEAVMALIASIFSSTINILVKDLIQRPRPTPDMANVFSTLSSFSFPSGHVMFYFGFFGFVWFLAFTLLKKSIKRSFLLAFFGALIALVGISRVYQGQHWASDVLGAYLLGSLTLVIIIRFYVWGKTRFFVHQPVAAEEPQKT
jgi:membrane-associated phospholipid phosphatase